MLILETSRLLLRRLTDDDLDDLHALYQDKEVREYFPEKPPRSAASVQVRG